MLRFAQHDRRPFSAACLGPEAAWLQGLRAPFNRALRIGGAKALPFLEKYIATLTYPTKYYCLVPSA